MSAAPISDARLAAAAAKLPAAPRIFQQLSAALKDPDVSVDAIVSVVRLDPSLSARVLRASNSVHFSRGGLEVSSLDGAIERIGINEVFQLVGAAVSSQLFSAGMSVYGVSGDELWENSVTTAVAMDFLAHTVGEDGQSGYTIGLLRPVGRLVLQRIALEQTCPPMSGRHPTGALVEAWEMKTLGTTSTEAVDRVFQMWEYSPTLIEPIRHHFAPCSNPANGQMAALLHVACAVAAELGKGLSIEREAWSVTDEVLFQGGIDKAVMDKCAERTRRIADRLQVLLRAA